MSAFMVDEFTYVVQSQKPTSIKPLGKGKSGALLATYRNHMRALIKVSKDALPSGKRTQRGLDIAAQPQREVAFYQLAKLLGYADLVPTVVITHKAVEGKLASAQFFVRAAALRDVDKRLDDVTSSQWESTLKVVLAKASLTHWRKLVALDLIAGSRDRHINNLGFVIAPQDGKPQLKPVAWDNAVTFGPTFANYHNVVHKYLFIEQVNFDDIWPVWLTLTLEDFKATLGPYLSEEAILHAYLRMRFLLEYPYRLPWRILSQRSDDPKGFPDYAEYFTAATAEMQRLSTLHA
jgi:hypothetical protein